MTSPSTRRRPLVAAQLPSIFTVLAGGFLGSSARAAVFLATEDRWGAFPSATLFVNVAGSMLLGWFLARRQRSVAGARSLQFWAIGVLGSFTTFSTFSLEVVDLLDRGHTAIAAAYVLSSLLGGLAAAVLGTRLGRVR